MGVVLYKKSFENKKFDLGDAPLSYGIAKHYKPQIGPYFGKIRGDEDNLARDSAKYFATQDDEYGIKDEDAFIFDIEEKKDTSAFYLPEIFATESAYNISIALNNAKIGDPVRGWIDFNGDGEFEENEKAIAEFNGQQNVILSWTAPKNVFTQLTFLRIRTVDKTYQSEIESPYGKANTGEVEDHAIRILGSFVDNEALKETVNPSLIKNTTIDSLKDILQKLPLGNNTLKITFNKTQPDILGINNKHDVNTFGIRVGHTEEKIMDKKNPMQIGIKSTASMIDFGFKIIDIDAGDRIKIRGFLKGSQKSFSINNLSDYFFYQFNSKESEVYGDPLADAGGDKRIPSSLCMGINIKFNEAVDSVLLTYTDDFPKTSGTFTIADINFRKLNQLPTSIYNFSNQIIGTNTISLNWEINQYQNLKTFSLQRSYDKQTFETIKTYQQNRTTNISIEDKNVPISIQNIFYRVKLIEIDNYASYSDIYWVKRRKSIAEYGFKMDNNSFENELHCILLKDFNDKFSILVYDYKGNLMKENWQFAPKKINDTIVLNRLENFEAGVYYFELNSKDKKYILEGYKKD